MRRAFLLLLALLLGTVSAVYGPEWLAGDVAAQPAGGPKARSDTADGNGGASADGAADEGESSLERLMERRDAVQGRTRRGQTIADAPAFSTTTRKDQLSYFPCADCHEDQEPNAKVRELQDEHSDLDFQHGGGRFWCYDACHSMKNLNTLVSLHGVAIDFDEIYKLCGQCHFQRQKDWYFGGHGKRVGTFPQPRDVPETADKIEFSERDKIGRWEGERVIHICTDCHNAHSPSIKTYKPSPPPVVRRGLTRREMRISAGEPLWDELRHALGESR